MFLFLIVQLSLKLHHLYHTSQDADNKNDQKNAKYVERHIFYILIHASGTQLRVKIVLVSLQSIPRVENGSL